MKETFSLLAEISKSESTAPPVLILVLRTLEHTYQKAGAMALLVPSGQVIGMVSGGCLEGDLLLRVKSIPEDRLSWTLIRYDTRSAEDDFLGTALGCRGLLDLAFISLPRFEKTTLLSFCEILSMSWSASNPSFGTVQILDGDLIPLCVEHPEVSAQRSHSQRLVIPWSGQSEKPCFELRQALSEQSVALPKRKSVLICGAGQDVVPLLRILSDLGTEITITDHRPGLLDHMRRHWQALLNLARELGENGLENQVTFSSAQDLLAHREVMAGFDAVLIMSHHLHWDGRYLDALRDLAPGRRYIGLLGPLKRRHEIFANLSPHHPLDCPELASPMGLSIGGRGSAAVAVSVAAELVQFWNQHNGEVAVGGSRSTL